MTEVNMTDGAADNTNSTNDSTGYSTNDSTHTITDRDNALFEAGIKLGALFHQFTGSPVNLKTAGSLEIAIQESISVQPYVEDISVKIDREMLKGKLNDEFGYFEIQGPMLKVKITVKYGSARVKVGMEYDPELDYPLMKIEGIEEI